MGHTVTNTLRQDVDVIFCVDPRPSNDGLTYNDLFDFSRNKKIRIIQRVGDVGTHGKPDLTNLVKMTTSISDRVIFTSEWAKNYIGTQRSVDVIPNGAMPVFYEGRKFRPSVGKPKVVTHHWSNNPMKGIDNYERLYREVKAGNLPFDFTFIGRSSNTLAECTIAPVSEEILSTMLPQFNVYLSSSLYEAGANHIVEAMAVGLPVVYSVDGGSIPEYCGSRGKSYSSYSEMVDAIIETIKNEEDQRTKSLTYVRTINDVVDEYVSILCGEA
jgi:glycosyltransferase involved in cell wall biosynthesis